MPRHARRHSAVRYAKMAKPTEMPFGWWTRVGRWNHVLCGVHWRNLASTTEPFVCGGNVVLCQITLTTCQPVYQICYVDFHALRT